MCPFETVARCRKPIGAEVDERDVRASVAVSDEDVLELEVAVRDARPVKRRERLRGCRAGSAFASRMCIAPERASLALSGCASMRS